MTRPNTEPNLLDSLLNVFGEVHIFDETGLHVLKKEGPMNTLRSRAVSRRKPRVGSISHGILVTEDLIQVFTDELTLYKGEGDPLVSEANIWLSHEAHGEELIIELMTALNELAPPYCYFGTHEGDGADFGFWPDWDQIDRLKLKDDEDRDPHEDYKEINDHGNVTVYSADGTILLEFV